MFTDDGKPKDITGASWKHGGAYSLPEYCIDGQQVLALFNAKRANTVRTLARKKVTIYMIVLRRGRHIKENDGN